MPTMAKSSILLDTLPHYWLLRAFTDAWAGKLSVTACLLLLSTASVWMLLLYRPLQRRLGLR